MCMSTDDKQHGYGPAEQVNTGQKFYTIIMSVHLYMNMSVYTETRMCVEKPSVDFSSF